MKVLPSALLTASLRVSRMTTYKWHKIVSLIISEVLLNPLKHFQYMWVDSCKFFLSTPQPRGILFFVLRFLLLNLLAKPQIQCEYKTPEDSSRYLSTQSRNVCCFVICQTRLATKGRLVTIGFITGYKSKLGFSPVKNATLIPKVRERISKQVNSLHNNVDKRQLLLNWNFVCR